ncbi:kelch repeat-containing protein [Massilia sp. TS11]|nr:kelch repeat-containing protein [Massilia sp. TS11]
MVGGEGKPGISFEVLSFDMASESFRVAGNLMSGRTLHTANLLPDGSVLIIGGSRTVSGTPVAERFDPVSGTARATSGQPQTSRTYHTATMLADGRVLIAGGITQAGPSLATSLEVYDPATERFTTLPFGLQQSRYGHVCVEIGQGLVMLYGGAMIDGKPARPEVIDFIGNGTTLLNPSFDSGVRLYANAVKRAGADWAVLGGETLIDSAPLPTTLNIGIGGLMLQPGPSLLSARSQHASATLGDGRVLITGGTADILSKAVASTEIYHPTQSTGVAGPNMATARMMHSATALPNGKVLIIGGVGTDRLALPTAELYS